jgi:hypothetical protein
VIGTAAVSLAMFGGITAATAAGHASIKACANKKTGALRLAKACHHNEKRVTWAAQGARGEKGARGPAGPTTDIAPSGVTQRGVFNLQGYGTPDSDVGTDISFPLTLRTAPLVDELDDATDAHCGGTSLTPTAAPGYLCLYIGNEGGVTAGAGQGVMEVQAADRSEGSSSFGAMLTALIKTTGQAYVEGTWAVTAP